MRKATKYFLGANIAILLVFTVIYLLKQNYEFFIYIISLLVLVGLVAWSDKYFSYPKTGLTLFTVWLLSHMLGGYVLVGSTVLYGAILVNITGAPLYFLRYDQLVHFFCYFVATFFTYAIIKTIVYQNTAKKDRNKRIVPMLFIAFLAAIGIGSLNEVIEFILYVILTQTGVGDLYNTGMDLIMNLCGAVAAAIVLYFVEKK